MLSLPPCITFPPVRHHPNPFPPATHACTHHVLVCLLPGPVHPLQFEREAEEADPFGLDAFLSDVRQGKKRGGALDDIGKGGGMRAAGGGSSYDQHEGGSGRRREFVSGGR